MSTPLLFLAMALFCVALTARHEAVAIGPDIVSTDDNYVLIFSKPPKTNPIKEALDGLPEPY